MKTYIKWTVFAAVLFTATAVFAQVTNSTPSTIDDIAKVFQDFGINISVATLTKFVGTLFVLGRLYMKYAPATWQQGKTFEVAKTCALHIQTPAQPTDKPVIDVQAFIEAEVKKALAKIETPK